MEETLEGKDIPQSGEAEAEVEVEVVAEDMRCLLHPRG